MVKQKGSYNHQAKADIYPGCDSKSRLLMTVTVVAGFLIKKLNLIVSGCFIFFGCLAGMHARKAKAAQAEHANIKEI